MNIYLVKSRQTGKSTLTHKFIMDKWVDIDSVEEKAKRKRELREKKIERILKKNK